MAISMSSPFPLLAFLLIAALWLVPILIVALSGRTRDSEKLGWVLACTFFPIIAPLLYLAIGPARREVRLIPGK